MLAALGRASRLFPPIEASLRTARPEACALSTREAADLVRDKALLLKASGFGVLLPGLDTRLNVRAAAARRRASPTRPRPDGLGLLNFNSLVSYDWQLALGDQPLTREEFEMLAQLKEPLVQLRGRWVDVRPDQIERALAFIQKHQARPDGAGRGALDRAGADHAGRRRRRRRRGQRLDRRAAARTCARARTVEVADEPPGFVGTLRRYQKRGVAWLATLQRYGLGALPGRRHGAGQDHPADRAAAAARAERGRRC